MIRWSHGLVEDCLSHVDFAFPDVVAHVEAEFHVAEYFHAKPCQDAIHFRLEERGVGIEEEHMQDVGH